MLIIAAIFLYVLSLLLIWQFSGYALMMALISQFYANHERKNYSYQPFVSIVVPTYNEEKSIGNRILNLLDLNYPSNKFEIIMVDSASHDNTRKIITGFQGDKDPRILLVEESERKGKASAINFSKKFAKGDIILVTDANSIFDRNVLREIMPHFENKNIGGVGGRFNVLNPTNSLTVSMQFYSEIEYIMRMGESILDSACLFHGEINAWRKQIVDADTDMLSEDLDMAIKIRKSGYKVGYEPNAIVYEPAPKTAEDQIRQRKRTAIGTIICIFKHWKYLFLPKDIYAGFIFHSHKTLAVLSPFLLISIIVLYILIHEPKILIPHFLFMLSLFAISLYFLIKMKNKSNPQSEDISFSINLIPGIIYYVLLNEYLILLAWADFLSGKYSVLWEKAKTTRGA